MHAQKSWITLTYADEHLPDDYSVSVRTVKMFMDRLRKAVLPARIRFFACGEYGEQYFRPHYHICIFGWDFPDKYLWRKSPAGFLLYRSPLLERTWGFGHSEIGELTKASAGYTARYMLKKVGGEYAEERYTRLHPITGEIVQVRSEFISMSNRPGIGRPWYEKYSSDAFPSDFVVVDGKRHPIPRYYLKQLKETDSNIANAVVGARIVRAKEHADNNTPERLATREELQELRAKKLIRKMETDT